VTARRDAPFPQRAHIFRDALPDRAEVPAQISATEPAFRDTVVESFENSIPLALGR
jgi:hypothetical protein